MLLALKSRGVDAYFVTDNNTYRGYGIFTKAYTLNTKTTVEKLIKVDNLHVDLVFDRGGFIGRDVLMINPPIITKIAQSKIEMYKYFTGLQPYSLVSHNKGEAVAAAEKIPGDKIVVKEPEGSGGKEVYIGDKEKVLAELPDRYPILIQEFLDTSPGIPGIVEGVHDVRVSLCGGDVISYYIRSAKEGEQRANVAQGGKMLYLDAKEVPADLLRTVQSIDRLFHRYPRYYSIDFMNTAKGWKMVEINSYLGLMPWGDSREAQSTLDKLANYLAAEAQKQAAA